MLQAQAISQKDSRTSEHYAVPLYALQRAFDERIDIYGLEDGGGSPKLLHSRSQPLSQELVAKLASKQFEDLYVNRPDLETLAAAVRNSGVEIWDDQTLSLPERFKLLQLAYSPILAKFYHKRHCGDFVKSAVELGRLLTRLLGTADLSPKDIHPHARHRYHSCSHFINVAAYVVLFARQRGTSEAGDLQRIATGAVLHEIGKLFVDSSSSDANPIQGRKAQATPRHPQLGFEALLEYPAIDFRQRLMAYQVHERYDGTGFPVALHGKEIDSWSQMLAIVDFFDDMTSKQRSREYTDHANVLYEIANSACHQFDPEMVLCWISLFQQA